jgi:PAS domain S-box-containing protein
MIPASMLRERQHADAQARESEARFREMAEHIQEAFFIVDVVRGTTLYVSPTWAKIWGRPLADGYDPKVWFEALHPDDRAAMASSQAAISRGETSDLVFRVIRPNGDLRWVRGLAYPVRNRLGTVHRLVGISEDITAQYEAQETVRRSHAQLSQTGRMAHVGGWQLHVDTQQLTLTDEVYRIFEVDPASTPTVADMMQLCKPSARSEVTAALQAAIEVGTAFDIELPIETARGREILVHAHGEADRQDGRVARVLGVVQDITERTRLDDLRRLQSAALDAAANAIVITDRQGTIVWTNLAFTRLTGYVTSEAIGRNPRDLVKSGKESVAFYRALWETILSGRTWEGETINRRKDGSLYTESQAITPITDASGAITHFVAIKIDITPRLTLEGQLRQAQKMETMGQLASAIAHDFNNLLTVINGVGELAIAEIAEDDPVRADVQEMVRAGERSAQLTRQLLAFGRRQVLQPKVIHLNTAVIDAQSLLRRLLGEEIELAFELSPDLGNVRADMGQLEQVIVNLAVNARDAMPRGGRLTVHTRNVVVDDSEKIQSSVPMPPGHYVQLSVRDTGIGMDEATLARIFDPFFTTKPLGEGTGLGLSTVWGIVGQSDGFVLVDSTLGLGTTFRILLPRVTAAHDLAVESRPAAQRTSGAETILVVDDTPEVRTLVRRLLESVGYHVLTAASGPEALQLLERHESRIHLVLTDVVMPEMGGRALADRVAASHREVRVLYMSGHTEDTVIQHGVLHATMPFLAKPFSKTALLEKVREVLDTPGALPDD